MSSGHRAISQASRLKRTTRNLVSLRIGTWSHDGCLCSLLRLAKVHSKVQSSDIFSRLACWCALTDPCAVGQSYNLRSRISEAGHETYSVVEFQIQRPYNTSNVADNP